MLSLKLPVPVLNESPFIPNEADSNPVGGDFLRVAYLTLMARLIPRATTSLPEERFIRET
jgi:hypothetical protein